MAIKRAAERAASDNDELMQLQQELAETQRNIDEENSKRHNVQDQSLNEKFDIRKAAQSSFNEIANIYSSGLGDIEVRILEGENEKNTSNISSASIFGGTQKGVKAVIREEDEDEDESLEKAEELRQQQLDDESALTALWNSVAKNGFVGDTNMKRLSNHSFVRLNC